MAEIINFTYVGEEVMQATGAGLLHELTAAARLADLVGQGTLVCALYFSGFTCWRISLSWCRETKASAALRVENGRGVLEGDAWQECGGENCWKMVFFTPQKTELPILAEQRGESRSFSDSGLLSWQHFYSVILFFVLLLHFFLYW